MNVTNELVLIDNGQPKTTTLQIAKGLDLKHKTVLQLVNSYLPDFMEFGEVTFNQTNSAFEMRNSTQGRWTRYAELNEQQATFLMTLMRNSEKVIAFKKALVKAFFFAREMLQTDYFSLVQKHSILQTKLDFEKDIASECGRGLSNWKKKRDCLQTAITAVEHQLQPQLTHFDQALANH